MAPPKVFVYDENDSCLRPAKSIQDVQERLTFQKQQKEQEKLRNDKKITDKRHQDIYKFSTTNKKDVDDILDMEVDALWSRLLSKDTLSGAALADEVAMESMDMRTRRKFILDKTHQLVNKTLKRNNTFNVDKNTPFKVRMGMFRKEKQRARREREALRESESLVTKQRMEQIKALTQRRARREKRRQGSKKNE